METTLPGAGALPAWHSRHLLMSGIETSPLTRDLATGWQSAHLFVRCLSWSKRAPGIHAFATRTGATFHAIAASASPGIAVLVTW